jgi:hypothetical protein
LRCIEQGSVAFRKPAAVDLFQFLSHIVDGAGRDRRKAGIKQGARVIFIVDAIPAVFGLC